MEIALIFGAALLGLAGMPHCAAMCGACGTAVWRGCAGERPASALSLFQFGRMVGYAAGGAVAASSVAWLKPLGVVAPVLQPLWTLLHVAALVLGGWMLATGELPRWLNRGWKSTRSLRAPSGWRRMSGPVRAGVAGLAWVSWPCGLLQSALVLAALADAPWVGAAAMAAFATASAPSLLLAPMVWSRLSGPRGDGNAAATQQNGVNAMIRVSGLCLAFAAAFALSHGLWMRVLAVCGVAG